MLALLFPGQGSQAVGMGSDLRARYPRANALFALADSVTGQPVAELSEHGPLDRLTATEVAQPAVVAASLAALAALQVELELRPAAVAGHSVGEYAAYVAASVLDADSAFRLVKVRAQAMAMACAAAQGSMAAVIGLDVEALRDACAAASRDGSSVEVANFNAPGNLIVSGARDALERLGETARAAGARRVLPLNVGGPFHSVYMRPAAEALSVALAGVEFNAPSIPVVLNTTAEAARGPEELRRELVVQVYSPVRWMESLQTLAARGCDQFLEVGPGTVLAGLVRRTLPDVNVASFGSAADLDAARAFVSRSN